MRFLRKGVDKRMNITNEINDFYYSMALHELQMMNEGDYYNGLSYNSILYINVIAMMEECTVSSLAEALRVTKSAVTLKVNELVKQGAVVRVQSEEDRRMYLLRLTPQMKEKIRLYDQVFDRIGADIQKKYSKEELELFGEILHSISGYEWRKS